jgi:hypothetical protein
MVLILSASLAFLLGALTGSAIARSLLLSDTARLIRKVIPEFDPLKLGIDRLGRVEVMLEQLQREQRGHPERGGDENA